MNLEYLKKVFGTKKPLIGMIHLAGKYSQERIKNALYEISILEKEGFHGAIIENYHGSKKDVHNCLERVRGRDGKIVLGLNLLGEDLATSINWARQFDVKFIQVDDVFDYKIPKNDFEEIYLLGGVEFKYTLPTGRSREEDISQGMKRCDAIVTTGDGTGVETPIPKLRNFRKIIGDNFPLIVGAGVNEDNIQEQLAIANGAIIGSSLKYYNDTRHLIEVARVRNLVGRVNS